MFSCCCAVEEIASDNETVEFTVDEEAVGEKEEFAGEKGEIVTEEKKKKTTFKVKKGNITGDLLEVIKEFDSIEMIKPLKKKKVISMEERAKKELETADADKISTKSYDVVSKY